jgi:DNA polymerase
MKDLFIDIETFSSVDLQKCGVYKYVQSPDFEILLFGYSVDGGDVIVIDLKHGEKIPANIISALTDRKVKKHAHNAMFERICLSKYLGIDGYLNPKQWRCTMIHGAYCGLPLSLSQLGEVLQIEHQKLTEGKRLIRKFCTPQPETLQMSLYTENSDWDLFKEYNRRDVETEVEIYQKLSRFPVPDFVWDEYAKDCEINDRGVLIDMSFVDNAVAIDERSREELLFKMKQLTDLDNPNSVAQLKQWLCENGVEVEKLGKKEVAELKKDTPLKLAAALDLRLKLAKSSVKKYSAMQACVCDDNRARGLFQFYAAHTGRSAGRIVQLQNLARGSIHGEELNSVRDVVRKGDYETLSTLYDNIPDTLSSLVRTALIPKEGCKFVVSDFSAIEARVLAWLAGEEWVLEVFRTHGQIYEACASKMYRCDISEVTKDMRQNGKTATLACGFSGGVGSLKAFGADKFGMSETDMQALVNDWRASNLKIVRFWYACEKAAKKAVAERETSAVSGLTFANEGGFLTIKLPSGRKLFYAKAKIGENRFGKDSVVYTGVNMQKKWAEIETYGGRIVENLCQAVARDLLFHSIVTLAKHNIDVVATIHDEAICEVPIDTTVEEVCSLMSIAPDWAKGLPLKADGYECEFYKKQ